MGGPPTWEPPHHATIMIAPWAAGGGHQGPGSRGNALPPDDPWATLSLHWRVVKSYRVDDQGEHATRVVCYRYWPAVAGDWGYPSSL